MRQRANRPSEYDVHSKLTRDLLAARFRAGLTQDDVAQRMGTSKSAVSRLEGTTRHSPSLSTLWRYANAVGYDLRLRLAPKER